MCCATIVVPTVPNTTERRPKQWRALRHRGRKQDQKRNEGEKQIKIKTNTGHVRQMAFQVAKVTKPLCSVPKICEKGHTVVYDESGPYVKH